MIKELQLQNFKCFGQSPSFEFSKINLLTGINGRGKSSLLQSLLILSQSAWEEESFKKLIIDGELVDLGNFDDIKNSETPRGENIRFSIVTDDKNIEKIVLSFKENEFDHLIADLVNIEITSYGEEQKYSEYGIPLGDISGLGLKLLLFKIHYVSADRLGPVKYVDKISLPIFQNVGARGEYTLNILANDNLPTVHESLYRGDDSMTVLQQTTEWLSYILEGAKIEIKGKDKESSVLYMLLNNKSNSYNYKPSNVGFGYSYVLPLIVTGLIARPGDIIIIENPEAHLHPRAQSKITEFFSLVASSGVQVFIESHSEHILNSLRVSALDPNIKIKNTDVTVHYFKEDFASEKLIVDEKGKIENWPEGFFDQQEIDLSSIYRLSR